MKKILAIVIILIIITIQIVSFCFLTGYNTQAKRASHNLSQEANNFNVVRQVTVINCINGDVLMQMTGKLSITADTVDKQLEIIVEDENGNYQKHFIGLSDNVTYVVEQKNYENVENYKYTLNFNPKMWLPYRVENID